uniref:AIG1-type G domain-containing protein n=1 Tax=Plectus sambesii TaxID=2011161 RepID=A0A914W3B8_9BILA
MDRDLQELFALNFKNIPESFKRYLISRHFTSIASLKTIPTEQNALRRYFADCPEFSLASGLQLRRSFQALLFEVNPEAVHDEYVSFSMSAKELSAFRNSMGQNTGVLVNPDSSQSQTAYNARDTSTASGKPVGQQPLSHTLEAIAEERDQVNNASASSSARVTQELPTSSHRQSNSSTTATTSSSVGRDQHSLSKPAPEVDFRSLKLTDPQPLEQKVRKDIPRPVMPPVQPMEAILPERVALLGQQIVVGAEYDASMNVYLNPKEQTTFEIKKAADGSEVPQISVFPFSRSLCERLNVFGLSPNHKVDFLIGLLENKLVASLANEPIAGSDEEKAIIHFCSNSHTYSQQILPANYQKNNAETTHVVVGVEYGSEGIFVLTEKKKSGQKSLIEYLTEVVDRIKRMKKDAGASIGIEGRFTKIDCKAYSISGEYQARNFYQAVIILHSLMTHGIDQKQPRTAIVLPLNRKTASSLQETLSEIERYAEMTISANHSLIELRSKHTDLSKLIGIESLEAALRSAYARELHNLKELVISARRGATDDKEIVRFLRENHTKSDRLMIMLEHVKEAIDCIQNRIQRPLDSAGISDKGVEPKIVLEIAIAPIDQSLAETYFSCGDRQWLNNFFPWLHSLGSQEVEEIHSFIEFCKKNRGKEQQFCYRFKKNTDSSRLFTCIYEDGGRRYLIPLRINGAFINISAKSVTAASITLSLEECWETERSDQNTAAIKTVAYEAQVCARREGKERAVATIKKITVPGDVIIGGLTEYTAYAVTVDLILPEGFTLIEHRWSKSFCTSESRVRSMISGSQRDQMKELNGFYELPKKVIVQGEGYRKFQGAWDKGGQVGEKVILVVGGTGSGKSTFINALTNYLYEVNFWNPFRLQLITSQDELSESGTKDKSKSQTKIVSAYELNGTRMPYRVTIVDTPGFGDTEGVNRDTLTMEYIKSWLEKRDATGLQTIDAVCTVIKSTETRFTPRVEYELRLVQSLFGENIKKNMITAFTFCDSSDPAAIKALNRDGLLVGEAMLNFNNRCFTELFSNDSLLDIFWNRTTKSFDEFFKIIDTFEPRSIVHTLEVLRHRRALEEQAVKFSEQATLQSKKVRQIELVIEQLNRGAIDLRQAQDFKIKQRKFKLVDIPVKNGVFTTYCKQCSITCHEDCGEVKNDDKQRFNCNMMTVNDPNYAQCTVCPNKCSWSVHIHSNVIIKQVEFEEEVTVGQMFEQYRIKMGDRNSAEIILELLAKDLLKEGKIMGDTIKAIRQHLKVLEEIALRPGLTTDSKYLIHLIEAEKQTMEEGAAQRIGVLERHLKIVKLLEEEQQAGGCIYNETETASIAYLGHKFPDLYKMLDDKGYFKTNNVRQDDKPVSSEKMLDYVERKYPVEYRSVSRNRTGNVPANENKAAVAESFKRTFPSLSATAARKLKEEEEDLTSLSGSDTSSNHSGDTDLAELNKRIDNVKLADDDENKPVSKPVKDKKIPVWKRLKKRWFS